MKEIEEELYKIHAEARQKKGACPSEETVAREEEAQTRLSPFLILDKVDEDSPAHTCVMTQDFFILTDFFSFAVYRIYHIKISTQSYHSCYTPLIPLSTSQNWQIYSTCKLSFSWIK
jgi:hypothetical protein